MALKLQNVLSVFARGQPARQTPATRRGVSSGRRNVWFGYRESRFKPADNPWVISGVTFRLSTIPRLVLDYGDVREAAGPVPTPQSVSQAIRRICSSKLPDPANIPNVGEFFSKTPSFLPNQRPV